MKRLIENFLQKWPTYLFEILVLIIGIYGAFALENWNEHSKNISRKEAIQKALIVEFEGNLKELEMIIQKHENSINASLEWIRLSVEQDDITQSRADSLLLRIYSGHTFDPKNGALRAAISSGDIHLLSNDSLLQKLFIWEDLAKDAIEDEINASNHIYHSLNFFNPNLSFSSLMRSDFKNIKSKNSDYQALLADPSFTNFVTIHVAFVVGAVSELKILRDENVKIIKSLKQSIR